MKQRLVLLLAALTLVPAISAADPCDKDRNTTCSDTISGERRVYDCLMGRKDRVAPACSQALDRASQLLSGAVIACKPEVQRWCAQYTGDGQPAVIDCLRRHKDTVGEDCRSKVRQFRAFGFDVKS